MKYFILIILFFSFLIPAYGQDSTNVVKTKYVQLDSIEKGISILFGGTKKSVEFVLVQLTNLSTNDEILGVEITIETNDTEVLASSIGLASVGSLWGSSANVTYRNIQNEGYILLSLEDLVQVIDFFNEAIQDRGNITDKRYRILKLTLYNRFEFGLLYDNKWEFVMAVDGANYTLDFNDGIDMVKKLNEFKNYIEQNQ